MKKSEIPGEVKVPDFLSGGGEMGERIRNFDWSRTPLGEPETWQQSLKTCVRIMLTSSQPIWIGWGNELIKLYNDPYIAIVGGRHPVALGQPASVVWKAIWRDIEPMLRQVMEKNEGTYVESQLLIMDRFGYPEETYYTFSYCPVPGDDGGTAGMICYNTADTQKIIHERSLLTLRNLDTLAQNKTEIEVYSQSAKALATNNKDFPYAIFYKIEKNGSLAVPVAYSGIDGNDPILQENIYLEDPQNESNALIRAVRENRIFVIENEKTGRDFPKGAWTTPSHSQAFIPIRSSTQKKTLAIIVAGLNPHRKYDDTYQNFLHLLSDQISLGVNTVIAYEEERKRTEALEQLDKAKTIFFSNISHEFRTPLTLMLGSLEEALQDKRTIPSNKARLEVTHRNSIRLLKLVNTLLDFSRIESGRQKANYTLTDLASFTKNLAGNFRSIIERSGIQFNVNVNPLLQATYIDKQMWEKIVFNLLSNAFKYTFAGSISINLFSHENHFVLEVQDTGVGIPENELPHMFERFYRVHNVVGRSYEGTGIGLSLIKELVLLHGGNIRVESQEGKGSRFEVEIPFGKDHLPAEQTREQDSDIDNMISDIFSQQAATFMGEEISGAKIESDNAVSELRDVATILVVDDNADMRLHIKSLLSKYFKVITAANGMAALHKIESEQPSLVLSDIMMPIMDGIQLLKEIKSNKKTTHLPVILLTARAGEESKVEGYEIGADDYLVKPFSGNELIARIKSQIKLNEKRKEVEAGLKSFLMQVPVAIAVLKGRDLICELANDACLNLIDMKREEFEEKSVFDTLPETVAPIAPMIRHLFETGKSFTIEEFEVPITRRGKKESGIFNAVFEPLKDENNFISGIVVASIEVTDQVLARKRVEQSALELQQLFKQAPVAILLLESDELKIKVANLYALQIMGKSEHEVLNKSFREIFPGSETHENIFRQVYNTGIPYTGKEVLLTFTNHDKDYKGYFDLNYSPWYTPEGTIKGVMSVGIEVTNSVFARKKIENISAELELNVKERTIQLEKKNEELMRSNRELESFNYIASHDLQEPLRKIQTFTMLLEKSKYNDESWKKYTEKISASSQRMSLLIQSLLDYSKISQPIGVFQLTDLNQIVKMVEADFELIIAEKEATIHYGQLPEINAIPSQMQQLFSNLISNSLKFSSAKPVINIKSEIIEENNHSDHPDLRPDKKYAKIIFSDNGIGFEPRYREQIFKLFQRLHNQSEYGGTGVGLSIVSKIVDNHHGLIEAESKLDSGSTFTIWFPLE